MYLDGMLALQLSVEKTCTGLKRGKTIDGWITCWASCVSANFYLSPSYGVRGWDHQTTTTTTMDLIGIVDSESIKLIIFRLDEPPLNITSFTTPTNTHNPPSPQSPPTPILLINIHHEQLSTPTTKTSAHHHHPKAQPTPVRARRSTDLGPS
ncbi:hypothetical protein BU16DRAFT_288276 [Lophium mytilinum]|uniref:Uncharacterized protein n=1 Tax=Lophium mytilinum TaxID=390894 RepID=A0A6A6R0L2_9PEZI|nr:hypothetical protein BU16DRAFT_288276 [Lophium mytilinum]